MNWRGNISLNENSEFHVDDAMRKYAWHLRVMFQVPIKGHDLRIRH
jgi:hypothetical protein